jgi:hypothetical protein
MHSFIAFPCRAIEPNSLRAAFSRIGKAQRTIELPGLIRAEMDANGACSQWRQ